MSDTLTLVLPILWVLVATFVGLVLYKSSSAIFRGKGLRLTGSVVIAGLAFYGMLRATPPGRLQPVQPGMSLVSSNDLERALQMSQQLDRQVLELQGCAATVADQVCQKKLLDLKAQSTSVLDFISKNLSARNDR